MMALIPLISGPRNEFHRVPRFFSRRALRLPHSYFLAFLFALFAGSACAQTPDPADQVCARYAAGSNVPAPPELFSNNGVLEVTFKFQTVIDAQGLIRYCYVTDTGLEAPTLHVSPGDQLTIHFQNDLPPGSPGAPMAGMKMGHAPQHAGSSVPPDTDCSGGAMGPSVTNLHFHGMNLPPTCHQDEVVHTLIQAGDTFDYSVQIPTDEPPGLYWYHPHPHGLSDGQVQGGATGALVVDGIQNVNASLAGLPQRLFVLRDQAVPQAGRTPGAPSCDISVNYVPVTAPNFIPAVVQTAPGTQEFWRVLNSSADTILNLQYVINGIAQSMTVVAIDGVPIGEGSGEIQTVNETNIVLPAGARAEFVVTTPGLTDQAQLVTEHWDAGPDGAADPARPILNIVAQSGAVTEAAKLPTKAHVMELTRFANLAAATPDNQRLLYFSESFSNKTGPNGFFLTVDGQTPAVFDAAAPPNLVVHQGSTEDWTVENRAQEDHVFHIHQLHFQVLGLNGQPVSDPALRDTVIVPHWSGSGPYPSVTMRMDFRDPNIVGLFVYHCHLLSHEDGGMMGAIQVLPPGVVTSTKVVASAPHINVNSNVTLTATVIPATPGQSVTGTVQFTMDGVPAGAPVALSNSQAVYSTALTVAGGHYFTARYSGDAECDESASDSLAVSAEDFSVTASNVTVSAAGQSGSAAITATPSIAFTGEISFTCSLPEALAEASCSLNPGTLDGGGKTILTITTTSPHGVLAHDSQAAELLTPWGSAEVTLVLASLFVFLAPQWKWRRPAILAICLCALVFLALGCASDGAKDPGTAVGTYSATVLATSGSGPAQIQHSVVLQVTVR